MIIIMMIVIWYCTSKNIIIRSNTNHNTNNHNVNTWKRCELNKPGVTQPQTCGARRHCTYSTGTSVAVCVYIYIEREREYDYVCTYIYVYIYIYVSVRCTRAFVCMRVCGTYTVHDEVTARAFWGRRKDILLERMFR